MVGYAWLDEKIFHRLIIICWFERKRFEPRSIGHRISRRAEGKVKSIRVTRANVAKLVDALDLGSSGATLESSSLSIRTKQFENANLRDPEVPEQTSGFRTPIPTHGDCVNRTSPPECFFQS
jgi:hypothetical protein